MDGWVDGWMETECISLVHFTVLQRQMRVHGWVNDRYITLN